MPHDMVGGEIGHEFVALVIALPPVDTKGERDRVGDVASCRRELVIHGVGGYKSMRTFQEQNGLCRDRPFVKVAPGSFSCCAPSCSPRRLSASSLSMGRPS